MALFRLLDSILRAEVEHHETKYRKDLCDRYPAKVAASGPDEIVRVPQEVVAVEGSKWRDQVTAHRKIAKSNAVSRANKATRLENSLQLEFKPSMRLEKANFYPIRQAGGSQIYENSFGMCVCVCWGGSTMHFFAFPCFFWTGVCETLSRGLIHMDLC